nr:RHS repeat-associated core domain-containing protein [Aliidiomarina quisquiliarum]
MHKDAQGSTVVITGNAVLGNVLKQQIVYDPWGKQATLWSHSQFIFGLRLGKMRGYTGHTMVNDLNLIHMGGRTYNPVLGRFMQADPFIQAGANLQNYNRYSYVLNNPLSYTDPSGYLFKKLNTKFGRFTPLLAMAVMIIPGAQPMGATMLKGFIAGGIATGNLRGAIVGGLTAGMGKSLGELKGFGSFMSRGIIVGAASSLQGGKFSHGFVSAGASELFGGNVGNRTGNFITSAIVGGTVSHFVGGKFANGALTAALTWALAQGAENAFSGDADTSVLDGPVGEGVSLYDGKISVHAAGEDAVLTDDQLSTVKSDLDLIFKRGGEEGQRLYNALDSDKPLKIIVNSQGANAAYLNGNVLSIDLSSQAIFIDQNTMKPFVASTTRILTHEMGHALLGLHDIHPYIPWIQIGDTSYQNSPVVRFTDQVMKNIHGEDAHRRRYY